MKLYIKKINNEILIKDRRNIVIRIENKTIFNPTEEMIFADGWVEYIEPELTEEEIFEKAKTMKIEEILIYDSSDEVNTFYMDENKIWLDKATRVGLKLRFDAEIASGQEETTLWYNGIPFNLNLINAIQMLNVIELYASACYDNTQSHIAAIKELKTVEEIEAYDYRVGYPEKLHF